MKKITSLFAFLLLCLAGMGSALAHGPNIYFGVSVGPHWGGPRHYPPYYYNPYYATPYYYPVAPVIIERPIVQQPQVYVEQQQPVAQVAPAPAPTNTAAPGPSNYWYYCQASQTYYPYVQTCAGGWQQVVPQAPSGQR